MWRGGIGHGRGVRRGRHLCATMTPNSGALMGSIIERFRKRDGLQSPPNIVEISSVYGPLQISKKNRKLKIERERFQGEKPVVPTGWLGTVPWFAPGQSFSNFFRYLEGSVYR